MDDPMLTTFDNPFNPFTNFTRWWKEDLILGHDTCGALARESAVSDVASDEVNERYIRSAMNRLVEREPTLYRIVLASDF